MIVIRVCWRSQWHTLHTRSGAQCAQVTLPIVDHRRQRGTFPFLQLLLEQPYQGQSARRLPVVTPEQQQLLVGSSSSSADGSGATILVLLWPKSSGLRGHHHRSRRRGGGGGGGRAGIDLLVDVGHFKELLGGKLWFRKVVPDRFHGQTREGSGDFTSF